MSNSQTRIAGSTGGDACATDACATILAGPGRLDCSRLAANISERQCLINQALAQAQVGRAMPVKRLWDCLDCDLGKEVQLRHPEGVEVEHRDQFGMPVKFKREAGSSHLAAVSRDTCVSAPEEDLPESTQKYSGNIHGAPKPQAKEEIRTTGETPVPLTPAPLGGISCPGILHQSPMPKGGKKARRLPAWLKNASPAVRRDYGF